MIIMNIILVNIYLLQAHFHQKYITSYQELIHLILSENALFLVSHSLITYIEQVHLSTGFYFHLQQEL